MFKKNKRISIWLWMVLLFFIFSFPRMLQSVKIIICVLLMGMEMLENRRISIRMSKSVATFLIFRLAYSALTVVSGVFQGNIEAGIIAFLRVNVFNLLLYIILISILDDVEVYPSTIKTIILATLYISIYNLIFIACGYLRLNIPLLEKLDATARIGFHIGYTHVVTTNLSMTIMLFPLVLMLVNDRYVNSIVNKKIHLITLIVCAISMVLSGRRILWISIGLGIVAFYLFNTDNLKEKIKYLMLTMVVVLLGIYVANRTGLISIDGLISRFQYAFASTDEYGFSNVREIQSKLLLDGFAEKPVFGNGAGATLPSFQRSETYPWAFELSYHAVLFQSGLVGFLFYFLSLTVICNNIRLTMLKYKKAGMAILISFVSVIIANATNPYFSSSFDFMIFIFAPLLMTERLLSTKTAFRLE